MEKQKQKSRTLLTEQGNTQKKKADGKTAIQLFAASFAAALFSHLFFIYQRLNGRYMTGMNDGLSQILPFKHFLYSQFKQGEFFYSPDFGLGGSFYTQLSYYFYNSFIYMATVCATYAAEWLGLISDPDIFYWADSILIVSILKLTAIIAAAACYFRYLGLERVPAFFGALLYGTSSIYFRHATYWDFFADAMLWLPLLLLGAEKVIREGRAALFLLAVSVTLFDNFYFAYINLLLTGIYILFRWLFPLYEQEQKKKQQLKLFTGSILAGFGISAVSFVPAVYGFLHNYRPEYEAEISLFGYTDNILLSGRILSIPAVTVAVLFAAVFYQNRMFRLFAALTVTGIILHYSPAAGSLFNGFSAPQYRWEYFLALAAAGTAAAGLAQFGKVENKRSLILPLFGTAAVYAAAFFTGGMPAGSAKQAYLLIAAVFTIILMFLAVHWNRKQGIKMVFPLLLAVISIICVNIYQEQRLKMADSRHGVSREYMESEAYNSEEQREMIRSIQESEENPLARIDWMTDTRNNTPLVQDFKGFSLYSSILNEHLLHFYLNDLYIDTGRESVSRYGTLGDRSNLYSMLMGKYYIAKKEKTAVPYGFSKVQETDSYTVYQNENMLPFVRTASRIYAEKDLEHAPVLAKEHAMLDGLILGDDHTGNTVKVPVYEDLFPSAKAVAGAGAVYENGILTVYGERGGLDIKIDEKQMDAADYYLSFYIKGLTNQAPFDLEVNEYTTKRKAEKSIYKTGVNKVTVRIRAASSIAIRLPAGKYKLTDFSLYAEDYKALQAAKKKYSGTEEKVEWIGAGIRAEVNNASGDTYAVLPVPYEEGWTAEVNGRKQELLKANFAFTGVELEPGMNEITLTYRPPYFRVLLFVSLGTAVLAAAALNGRRLKRRNQNRAAHDKI